jgi:cyclopropane fatty-acyl-phospholipid synthase-like methyltransferase
MSSIPAPFSQACENNREPILRILKQAFSGCRRVLEIGSGTGQHSVYFAPELPHLVWQCSDQPQYLDGIRAWHAKLPASNLAEVITLEVCSPWPQAATEPAPDAIYSANTAHIMSQPMVEAMFAGIGRVLQSGGRFCLYGPFNYRGDYSSDSNRVFDAMLRQRDPQSGIRDQEWILMLAAAQGLELYQDHAMPANNRLLEFIPISLIM